MLLNNREKSIDRPTLLQRLQTHLQAEHETADAQQFLEEVVRISELLVEQDADTYEFAHWSFQEYLAAREILQQGQESLLYERFEELEWKPTILLYAAQVKNPSSLIQALLERGAADLAHACLPEITKQIPPALTAEIARLKQTVQTSRYAKLEDYLKNQQWKQADEETYRVMITTVGKESGQYFKPEELLNFPCEELLAIDRLWVSYSKGHFGFSVQKDIYLECGGILDGNYHQGTFEKFGDRVGWRMDGNWLYPDIPAGNTIYSFQGKLPGFFMVVEGGGGVWGVSVFLFSRIAHCEC